MDFLAEYMLRKWVPIRVEYKGKNPTVRRWQNQTILDVNTDDFDDKCNVGIVLGEASGGLVDIDIDCQEALSIAHLFLPDTGVIFGRKSKPRSHWLYQVVDCSGSKKFVSPGDNSTLVEYRSTGGQTVFPPSIHTSGEQIGFELFGRLKAISHTELNRIISQLVAVTENLLLLK